MEAIEFLRTKEADFVYTIDSINLIAQLKEIYSNFRQTLSKLSKTNFNNEILARLTNDYENIQNSIIAIFEKFYSGRLLEAENEFTTFFNQLQIDYPYFFDERALELSEPGLFGSSHIYYRARKSESTLLLKEMFHIPFNQRGFACTGRFNLPGMPCLYFGKSIHSCWEELKQIPLKHLHVSSYRAINQNNIRILNFSEPLITAYKTLEVFSVIVLISFINQSSLQNKKLEPWHEDVKRMFLDIYKINIIIPDKNEDLDRLYTLLNNQDEDLSSTFSKYNISFSQIFDFVYYEIKQNAERNFSDSDSWNKKFSEVYKGQLQTMFAHYVNNVIIHPLKIALSLRNRTPSEFFKPEYYMSQLLMKWLFQKNQDEKQLFGVSYLSSRIPDLSKTRIQDINLYRNYVFPTVPLNSQEYCQKIHENFQLTESVCVGNIERSNQINTLNKGAKIYSSSPLGNDYDKTYLYFAEQALSQMTMHSYY